MPADRDRRQMDCIAQARARLPTVSGSFRVLFGNKPNWSNYLFSNHFWAEDRTLVKLFSWASDPFFCDLQRWRRICCKS